MMMMLRASALLGCAALLGACAAPDRNLVAAQQYCASAASVLQEITCTRTRLEAEQWRQSPIANDIATYLAYADSLAERVRAGRMTDGDARQDLRQMLQRLRSELQSAAPLPGAEPS